MRTYIIRRLLLLIPTLFIITVIVFCAVRFIPGHVVELMAKEQVGSVEDLEAVVELIKHNLGLDVPIYVQYGRWMAGIFKGDLGTSLWTGRSITDDMATKLPVSIELGIIALITSLGIAFPIGILSAIRQDSIRDYIGRSVAIFCISVPSFWLATLVIVYPSLWWGWTPSIQCISFLSNPLGNLGQFIIPGILLGMLMSGVTMRMTRTMMLEVLRQDYVRTAWSKGLKERLIISRHILKNALIPVVTIIGLQLPVLVGGAVIIETIFNLPGIGRYFTEALFRRDYPIVCGVNLVVSAFTLVCILIVDIAYAYLDPRVQYK